MIASDRLRSYVRLRSTALQSCAIECDRDRTTMFYACDRLRSATIKCNHLSSKFCDCDRNVSHNTCVSFGKMKGEIDTEQFMEEIKNTIVGSIALVNSKRS